ncbi:type II CRISPR-associated endonuclease Cas1 [Pseudobdellovibrio exovorus]|uniref:CRISPR-associated endonuclease Cas1 n=1 Tax=Pseudobdellovibrio exovorus JSS TaxID=1184267 RepID=M4V6X5_9BACT|nr:type II CRISPR-associated endonuclease Cas1 [Pseudobdellovibrio exovorus]AGH95127.1 CRISPR-associated protein Cas1 [Pseudobdellovibrio exovorus JSS]
MKNHVLEFLSPGLKITKSRGHLVVLSSKGESEIPLDDIFTALILSEDVLISTNVVTSMIERNIPIIFCDSKYTPLASMLGYQGHSLTQKRQAAQISLSDIQKGRLWQKAVKQKIWQQHQLLKHLKKEQILMDKFFHEVEIHDETNLEAQAARLYWKTLFGDNFRRDPVLSGTNSFLNYGYAILRSAVARSVASSGLNPTIGIHHSNFENPFCLVDDLMEPFRPLVDSYCYTLQDESDLSPQNKRKLSIILEHEVIYRNEKKPLSSAIHEYCHSFTNAILNADYKLFDTSINLNFYAI